MLAYCAHCLPSIGWNVYKAGLMKTDHRGHHSLTESSGVRDNSTTCNNTGWKGDCSHWCLKKYSWWRLHCPKVPSFQTHELPKQYFREGEGLRFKYRQMVWPKSYKYFFHSHFIGYNWSHGHAENWNHPCIRYWR